LVVMEDTVAAADAQIYVPDPEGSVTINPDITLPGFKVGKPRCTSWTDPIPPISAISPSRRRRPIRA
jgi:hypothetical protein